MLEFLVVHGDVVVEDKKNKYMQAARPGLKLPDGGQYLIVTGPTSSAVLLGKKNKFRLPESSVLWVTDQKGFLARYYDQISHDSKIQIGRVWAKLLEQFGNPDAIPEDVTGNAVVGVRG